VVPLHLHCPHPSSFPDPCVSSVARPDSDMLPDGLKPKTCCAIDAMHDRCGNTGRKDLARAIQDCGGLRRLAAHMGGHNSKECGSGPASSSGKRRNGVTSICKWGGDAMKEASDAVRRFLEEDRGAIGELPCRSDLESAGEPHGFHVLRLSVSMGEVLFVLLVKLSTHLIYGRGLDTSLSGCIGLSLSSIPPRMEAQGGVHFTRGLIPRRDLFIDIC
jgi:hypothetical protein